MRGSHCLTALKLRSCSPYCTEHWLLNFDSCSVQNLDSSTLIRFLTGIQIAILTEIAILIETDFDCLYLNQILDSEICCDFHFYSCFDFDFCLHFDFLILI